MKNCIDLTVILDRSGSMASVRATMEEVMNGYVAVQKNDSTPCIFSLVQFDHYYDSVIRGMSVQSVGTIHIEPRGSTALLDAIGRTIDDTGKRLSCMHECERPERVLIVIVTDGMENASKLYTKQRVFDMIKHQREAYKWEFVFLGADQDAISAASGIGIPVASTLNYDSTVEGARGMGAKLVDTTHHYKQYGAVRNFVQCSNKVTTEDTEEWKRIMADLAAKNAKEVKQ